MVQIAFLHPPFLEDRIPVPVPSLYKIEYPPTHFWNSSISESPATDTTRYFLCAPVIRELTQMKVTSNTVTAHNATINRSFPDNAIVHVSAVTSAGNE